MYRILYVLFFSFIMNSLNASEPEIALKIVQEKCQYCHGLKGEVSNTIHPRLAGQNKDYIIKQLHDFRSGYRKGIMNEMVGNLTDTEIEALANYFSSRPTLAHRSRNKELAYVGWYIFRRGNNHLGLPACAFCHGEKGEGSENLPRLAGQHKRYVLDQLHEFNKRTRTTEIANTHHAIISTLTQDEIEAVATYISRLK